MNGVPNKKGSPAFPEPARPQPVNLGSTQHRTMVLNLGPSHPATHGIMHNVLEMDGERIVKATPIVGYMHRGFDKLFEHRSYTQSMVYLDRANYVSAPLNDMAWVHAIEEMMGIEDQIPEKARAMRVLFGEVSRIIDHLVCVSVLGVDLGGLTGFLYVWEQRERAYRFIEKFCGSRLTTTFSRVGGLEFDVLPDLMDDLDYFLKELPKAWGDLNTLLTRNRIFIDRTRGVGAISAEDAISYGFTGPNLRATGVAYDVRKARPYFGYDRYDFDVPVGTAGDTYDRYLVRMDEIVQSARIIEQVRKDFPMKGPYKADLPHVVLPDKLKVYETMEGMIYHFKLVMQGFSPPVGEFYSCSEGANGELGFYIVSQGEMNPYRAHFRRPCFIYYQAFPQLVEGGLLSDAIAIMSSINVIAGELDA